MMEQKMGNRTIRAETSPEYAGLILPINRVDSEQHWNWLRRGWQDLRRAREVSLVFGVLIALASIALLYGMWQQAWFAYTFPLASGYMFVAPFLGMAFYEISRRLEIGSPFGFWEVAFAWRKRPAQILTLGLVMMLFQIVWMRIALLLYALFYGLEVPQWDSFVVDMLTTTRGFLFLAIGSIIGGAMAVVAFALTVVSFPLLLDRDVGTAQAIATSVAASLANWRVMLGWGALIVFFTAAGLLTGCIGLVITMPLIGHASWHAYRDLIDDGR
jgi:uncharacterized membrane protein